MIAHRPTDSIRNFPFAIRVVPPVFSVAFLVVWWTASAAFALDDWSYGEPSSEFRFRVRRFEENPIVHRGLEGLRGEAGRNINGPSLVRVPGWVENPLGRYYLYFAHHHGKYIRLAYADRLEGPWTIHEGGVLRLEETPSFHHRRNDHIASPDVHVDHDRRRIRMYYHGLPIPDSGTRSQMTYVAVSPDGLQFQPLPDQLGLSYFRVFERDGWHYALAKNRNDGGIMYRSRDGLSPFEQGPRILPRVRHMALWEHRDMLYVFFSRGGDEPEHILVSRIENLDDDWREWRFTRPQTVLRPEKDYEGAREPIRPSRFGATYGFVHQLRDPAIYEEDDRVYLLYSTAGEHAIAIAEIILEEQ